MEGSGGVFIGAYRVASTHSAARCRGGGRWSKQGYGVLWKVYMVMSKGYGVARGLR